MNLIFLVGMPGVGKSHWGRIWAATQKYDFSDLDEHVEAQAGLSIADIFHGVGEQGFRVLEAAGLLDTISAARGRNTIIATGGGTPVFNSNMDTMLRTGCVVYLQAGIDTLIRQLNISKEERPLLQEYNEVTLKELLEIRQPFYQRAHINIPVEKATPDTFAQILEACTSRRS